MVTVGRPSSHWPQKTQDDTKTDPKPFNRIFTDVGSVAIGNSSQFDPFSRERSQRSHRKTGFVLCALCDLLRLNGLGWIRHFKPELLSWSARSGATCWAPDLSFTHCVRRGPRAGTHAKRPSGLALSRYVNALFRAPRGFTHDHLLQHFAPAYRRQLRSSG